MEYGKIWDKDSWSSHELQYPPIVASTLTSSPAQQEREARRAG